LAEFSPTPLRILCFPDTFLFLSADYLELHYWWARCVAGDIIWDHRVYVIGLGYTAMHSSYTLQIFWDFLNLHHQACNKEDPQKVKAQDRTRSVSMARTTNLFTSSRSSTSAKPTSWLSLICLVSVKILLFFAIFEMLALLKMLVISFNLLWKWKISYFTCSFSSLSANYEFFPSLILWYISRYIWLYM